MNVCKCYNKIKVRVGNKVRTGSYKFYLLNRVTNKFVVERLRQHTKVKNVGKTSYVRIISDQTKEK